MDIEAEDPALVPCRSKIWETIILLAAARDTLETEKEIGLCAHMLCEAQANIESVREMIAAKILASDHV